MKVSTGDELRTFVLRLVSEYESKYENKLEEYLRSTWLSVRNHFHEHPSYDLFSRILEEGFLIPPPPWEPEWLNRVRPPENPWWLPHPDFSTTPVQHDELKEPASDFHCLEETLLFQIAELHRFSEKKPENYGQYAQYARDYKYFGLESPTGYTWYNWDPFTYLECAISGFTPLLEAGRFKETTIDKCNWATLAAIFELGRTHE